jgi:hypothetical protein
MNSDEDPYVPEQQYNQQVIGPARNAGRPQRTAGCRERQARDGPPNNLDDNEANLE